MPPRRRAILTVAATLAAGIAGLAMVTAAQPAQAGEVGLVTTADGRTLEGQITDNGQTITVTVRGVSTTIDKTNVASVDYATFADRFRDRLALLGDGDIKGRLDLAREALDRKEYDLSFSAIDSALSIDPLDREGRRLSLYVQRQMTLDQASTRAADPADADAMAATEIADEPPTPGQTRLSPEQINRLRQIELQPGDRVRVRFLNNVRKRFVDTQAGVDIRAFIRRTDTDQALQIIRNGTRDMLPDVQIITDPSAIHLFGRHIHVPVLQGCATSACHGGDNAGNFKLLNTRLNTQVMLTNYFLITSYRQPADPDAGEERSPFGGGAIDMVERTKGERSLLYQYALPRRLAATKHPPVRGWDGMLRNVNDRFARDLVGWMNVDLASVRPDYDEIDFALVPRKKAETTTDATEPTTEPTR